MDRFHSKNDRSLQRGLVDRSLALLAGESKARRQAARRKKIESITRLRNVLGLVSFLLPPLGWVLGAIFVAKENEEDREIGKICLLCSFGWFALFLLALLAYGIAILVRHFTAFLEV